MTQSPPPDSVVESASPNLAAAAAAGTAPAGVPDRSWSRPDGLEGSFEPHEPLPPAPAVRQPVPAGAAEVFGRTGADAFDAPAADRLPAQHRRQPAPIPPDVAATFAPTTGGTAGFEPAPGTRLSSAPEAQSPWWKPDAAVDPWRNADSAYFLGRPAQFVDNDPLAVEDGEELVPDPPESADDTTKDAPAATLTHGRFGLRALLAMLVVALLAGGIGGGAGYLLTRFGDDRLHDPDVKLAQVATPVARAPGSVADVARKVSPAVVQIVVKGADEAGTGSGVVIDSSGSGGYILTNNHVVSVAGTTGTIRVVFADESLATASIVGRDPSSDLAVIKVSHSPLTVMTLGKSSELAVGDPVIAIGSPLGLQGTVTTGIVSALQRAVHVGGEGSDTDAVIDAIQTDAAINPGNSGGALVDAGGKLIGIPSAGATLNAGTGQSGSIGLGFAIPIDSAIGIATQIIKTGKVVHASLGAQARSVTDGSRLGAYLVQVDPGQAAAKAGLKEGDVIKLIDKTLITGSDSLVVAVNLHKPGDAVSVRYVRAGKELTATLTFDAAK